MEPTIETLEVLRQAREVLIRRGRAFGTMQDEHTGKVCPLGAVVIARGEPVSAYRRDYSPLDRDPAVLALAGCIDIAPDRPPTHRVWRYSDSCAAQEEVVALFDCAIERLQDHP